MPKEKKQYHAFPVVARNQTCPVCGDDLVTSKLMAVLYDGFNQHTVTAAHKMKYCNSCHVPFLTKMDAAAIEEQHPGFHLEIKKYHGYQSRAFLQKEIETPARPIRNLPKKGILFFGEPKDHACGEDSLASYHYVMHGTKGLHPVLGHECAKCKRILLSPLLSRALPKDCPDYLYAHDTASWDDIHPDQKPIFLLGPRQYEGTACPACGNRLKPRSLYLKNDKNPILQAKALKECSHCRRVFGRMSSFRDKPYSLYRFSPEFYSEEPVRPKERTVVLTAGDFLTRYNIQHCVRNGHDVEDITARVPVADPAGNESFCDVPAVHCHTCGKLYLLETEYQHVRNRGVPLCSVVEREYWERNKPWESGPSASDPKGSVMYLHGYNVNAHDGLTAAQRRAVLRALLRDGVLTRAAICSHLDTLIQRAENQPVLGNAREKWVADRKWMETQAANDGKPVVTARSITKRTYRAKTPPERKGSA